jgi:hypothetical protein
MRINIKVVDKPQHMPPTRNFVEISPIVFLKNECLNPQRGTAPPLHVNFMKVTQKARVNESPDTDRTHRTVTHVTSIIFRSSDENFITTLVSHSLFTFVSYFLLFPCAHLEAPFVTDPLNKTQSAPLDRQKTAALDSCTEPSRTGRRHNYRQQCH